MCLSQDSPSATLAVAGQCEGTQIQVPFDLPLTGYGKDGKAFSGIRSSQLLDFSPLSSRYTLDMEYQVLKTGLQRQHMDTFLAQNSILIQ